MASIRRQVRIARARRRRVGDRRRPGRVRGGSPASSTRTVDGTTRVITTASGIPMPEEIVTNDPIQRRFQYRHHRRRIVRNHLGTIDVFDLGDGSSLVVVRDRLRARRRWR